MVLGRAVCQPEKRKVDSSILSPTTTYGRVLSALTSAYAYLALSRPQPSNDRSYPCVTVVRHPLSHADRTPRASGGYGSSWLREWDGRRYHARKQVLASQALAPPGFIRVDFPMRRTLRSICR